MRSSSVDQRTREKAAIKAREAAIFMNMAMERNAESGFCSRSMSGESSHTPSYTPSACGDISHTGSMKTALMLAYYFPPMGLGGVQRALKFVRHLPSCGWRPAVVTVNDVVYYEQDASLLDEIPDEALIHRTGSLDPLRMAWLLGARKPDGSAGRNRSSGWIGALMFPDPKMGWIPYAVNRSLRLIRSRKIDALFTTFPPASCLVAGWMVHRLTGLPWVADFRDALVDGEFEFQPTAWHRKINRRLQRAVMSRAAHIIAVSDQIASAIQKSAPDCAPVSVIPNGYDPEDFIHLPPAPPGDRFTLTYVGAMTPARNPEPLFRGLSRLFDRRPALKKEIEVRLIGAALGLDIGAMIREYDLIGVARQSGYLPHREALTQLLASDALVLLITSPDALTGGVPTGKIYEYLASGRPILGIAPPGVATDMIRRFNRGASASPEQPEAIARLIEEQVEMKKSGRLRIFPVDDESVRQFGRPFLTRQLAGILDHVTTQPL